MQGTTTTAIIVRTITATTATTTIIVRTTMGIRPPVNGGHSPTTMTHFNGGRWRELGTGKFGIRVTRHARKLPDADLTGTLT